MRIIEGATIASLAPTSPTLDTWLTEPDELQLLANFQALTDHNGVFLAEGFTSDEIFWSRY